MNPPQIPNPDALNALELVIQEVRYLVEHPRIQQRTWVASGTRWLPLLHIIHGELTGRTGAPVEVALPEDENTMLVKVNMSTGTNYAQIRLSDIDRIQVNDRRASGSVTLKNGRNHITSAEEAQRIVDRLRKRDESASN